MLTANVAAADASIANQHLTKHHPLPENLRHLKRLRKLDKTIIQIILYTTLESCDNDWEKLCDSFPVELNEPRIVQVPACSPRIKADFERFNKYWPVSFHQSMTEKLNAQLLEEASNIFLPHSNSDAECLVIGPDGQVIVSASSDDSHPLKHAVMCAIDSVAKLKVFNSLPPQQYLCNSFYFMLKKEPCFMCAMAMVHSRVKAVAFSQLNLDRGAFKCATDSSWLASTNHNYNVYKIVE